jgi:CMP-N-acetylneuraminic acid synthetase
MACEVVALIGVRGGSKRVTNKNRREFSDTNLLALKINTLRQVSGIDRIVVNSECPILLEIAKKCGAETVIRDPAFATDEVLTSDYYCHIAENCPGDIILSATVTTPLVKPQSYEKGIQAFLKTSEADHDSVTSARPIKEFLYLDGRPLNYDPARQVRSQDLPNIVALNYGFSIIRRQHMIECKNIVGKHPFFVQLPQVESIDIDTAEDFFIAETLYNALRIQSNSMTCQAA